MAATGASGRRAPYLALAALFAVAGCASGGGEFPSLSGGARSPAAFQRENELWSTLSIDAARCGATPAELSALARVRANAALGQLQSRQSGASEAVARSMVDMIFEGPSRPRPTPDRCARIRAWLPSVVRKAATLPG